MARDQTAPKEKTRPSFPPSLPPSLPPSPQGKAIGPSVVKDIELVGRAVSGGLDLREGGREGGREGEEGK